MAANVIVIGGGWLTWALLAKGLGWQTPTIAALGASVAAAAVVSAILFDNWPAASAGFGAGLALTALQIAILTAVLFFGLRLPGNALQTWDRDPVELWVTVGNLDFIAAAAIAHVAVFRRPAGRLGTPVMTSVRRPAAEARSAQGSGCRASSTVNRLVRRVRPSGSGRRGSGSARRTRRGRRRTRSAAACSPRRRGR